MERNKVIFLCTGNICRSPIGEGLLKHAISALPETDPLKKLVICSAGTSAMTGMPASQHSVDVLEKVGVDISQHKATQLNSALLEECFALFEEYLKTHKELIVLYTIKGNHSIIDFTETYGEEDKKVYDGGVHK